MKHQRVLVIEDDKDTAVLFQTVLNLVGFECDIVLTAREALAWLAASVPDLVLLDIRLGLEISGGDILYQIRNNPRFDKTRVVVITGFPRLAEPITDLADLILLKPVEIDQLRDLVSRVVVDHQPPKLIPFQDPVTELYKPDFFISRLKLAFERAKRRDNFQFGVMVLEAKFTKRDEQDIGSDRILDLLREIARRLQANLRPMDTISRLAGWRFTTLIEELTNPADIEIVVKRIIYEMSKPYQFGGKDYEVDIFVGASIYQPGKYSPDGLVFAAEELLKAALSTGISGTYRIAATDS